MEEKIDTAIHNVLAMIRTNGKQDEALKFSQAALNLAHAKHILCPPEETKKRAGSASAK
jgi:hypothetical protein